VGDKLTNDLVEHRRSHRLKFMNALYRAAAGSMTTVDADEVARDAGVPGEETDDLVGYLQQEGLLELSDLGRDSALVRITHLGTKEVEKAMLAPDAPTTYFPPAGNYITIGTMIGSQLQQGTVQSTLVSQSATAAETELLSDFISAFRSEIDRLPDELQRREAEAELATIESQLNSPKPKKSIILESLRTLKRLAEGVSLAVASHAAIEQFFPG
jgi:hypothetical protein